ncbi:transposase, partial [Flavonifractor plautii]|nr:transposase [Flavonifractor plautii]
CARFAPAVWHFLCGRFHHPAGGTLMSSKRVCPNCGRKMKQQLIGLFHCKCGLSWKRDIGFFERTPNMVFALERIQAGKKVKQVPVIRYK